MATKAQGPLLYTHEDFVRALAAMDKRITSAVAAGTYLLANTIIADAKRRAPRDTGTLSRSGYATLPEWGETVAGNKLGSEIGFGGFADKYAVPQHENTTWSHNEGEAKYLQTAIDKFCGTVGKRAIVEYANAVLAQGGAIRMPPTGGIPQNPYVGSLAPRASGRKRGRRAQLAKLRSKVRKKAARIEHREQSQIAKERARLRKKLQRIANKEKRKRRRRRIR